MDELIKDVKNYLDISWNDEHTDKKIEGIVKRGIKYLNSVAGGELDYFEDDKPKELLLDYCRYARSHALNEFQDNYLHELLTLQIKEEVSKYESTDL